jgi:hypothetical protein
MALTDLLFLSFSEHSCFFTANAVTGLTLPSNGLRGRLPSEIGLLRRLRTMNLSGNPGITGSIPREIADLDELGKQWVG